jgi:hypothetical protein
LFRQLRILQIGDVHYVDAAIRSNITDVKDPTFPPSVLQELSTAPLQATVRAVATLVDRQNIDAIAIMGDLTDRGSIVGYQACYTYFLNAFLQRLRDPNNVVIVPGNHDLERMRQSSDALRDRFQKIDDFLRSVGRNPVPFEEAPALTVARDGGEIQIFSVNTCFACGTKRYLPSFLSDAISDRMDAALAAADLTSEKGRQILGSLYDLDTPAVHDGAIQSLTSEMSGLAERHASLVVGHHNLVPQRTVRIAPYTEMVNSGAFRSALLKAGRPVLYLHGHIHEDPIEVMQEAGTHGMLVLVGAPLFDRGFNVVSIEFDNDGVALGCQIEKYRTDSVSQCRLVQTVDVGFWRGRPDALGALDHLEDVTLNATSHSADMYFRDVLAAVASKVEGIGLADVARALRRLWWLGFVSITHAEHAPARWTVRRK